MPPSPICCKQLVWPDAAARPLDAGRFIHGRNPRHRRLIQKPAGGIVCGQQSFDPLPQLGIGAALTFQDLGACRGVGRFDGEQENGLDAIRINWHC